jgi:Protein of unknown function (DUF1570)
MRVMLPPPLPGSAPLTRPRPSGWSRVFFAIRLAVLLGTFTMTAWLVKWNRAHDPRFFWVMQTRPAAWLTGRLAPRGPLASRWLDPRPLNEEERRTQAEMARELAASWPTHRVRLLDGREFKGRILEQTSREVVIEEQIPRAGAVRTRWPVSRIDEVERLTEAPPPVLDLDVRFRRSLPDLHYFRSPPFTLMTDQSVFDSHDRVEELRALHRELGEIFAPLVTQARMRDGIQLVVFEEEEAYAAYCEATAPRLENSAGFYAPATGRLALFNQRSAEHVAQAREQLSREAERAGRKAVSVVQKKMLMSQVRALRSQIDQMADRASRETLRHEGAHQYLHLAGVHSRHYAENAWLLEGLAMWCETKPAGSTSALLRHDLRRAREDGLWLDWVTLLAHRSPSGFFSLGDESAISCAYAQSWLLVHWLMQPVRREVFFDFLRHLREDRHVWEVATTPAHEILCRFLGLDLAGLEENLAAYERLMVTGP